MNRRDNDILITKNGFEPNEIRVEQGTEVNFINEDESSHVVVSEVEIFDSGEIGPKEMYSRVFDDPGTQNFFLDNNQEMLGRVIVE